MFSKIQAVIIGNGTAAIHAIRGLRGSGFKGTILLISEETGPAYNPMLLPYYMGGEIEKEGIYVCRGDFYTIHQIKRVMGQKVTGLDTKQQVVQIGDQREVPYDLLLIAAGAKPTLPDIPGINLPGVFSFRKLSDVIGIKRLACRGKQAIVVGASLIGLKVCEVLRMKGVEVGVVDMAPQILPQNADSECATLIQSKLEEEGITLFLQRRVQSISLSKDKLRILLNSGERLCSDMVVFCTGIKPNIELVKGTPIKIDQGILVDHHLKTTLDHVYAAGDVTAGKNLLTGKNENIPNWLNACLQGRIAGMNMAGHQETFEGSLRRNIAVLFGMSFVSLGQMSPTDNPTSRIKYSQPDLKIYRSVILSRSQISGAVLLNDTLSCGILSRAIECRSTIRGSEKWLDRYCCKIEETLLPLIKTQWNGAEVEA